MHGTHHDHVSAPDATDSSSDESRSAINRLATTRDPAGIERLADELTGAGARGWTGDTRRELIETLVLCLAGDSIRADADAEDALCSALEQLGVMTRSGNLRFEFAPDDELAPSDLSAVRRYRAWLPIGYASGVRR
jgi:hypothetical protein